MSTSREQGISTEDLLRTAELAGFRLTPDEAGDLTASLHTILGYFDRIGRVPLEHSQTSLVGRVVSLAETRMDVPVPSASARQQLTLAAPDFEEEHYFVPRVL